MNDRTKRILMGITSTVALAVLIGGVMGIVAILSCWAYMSGYYGG